MSNKRLILITVMTVFVIIMGLYGTYALDVGVIENTPTDYDLSYTFDIYSNTQKQVTITAGKTKVFDIDITNSLNDSVQYGVAYSMISPTTLPSGIAIAQSSVSANASIGLVNSNSTVTVSIVVENTSTSDITIELSVINGYKNGGDLIVDDGKTLITDIYEIITETPEVSLTSDKVLTKLGLTSNTTTPNFSTVATTNEGVFAAEDDLGTSYYFRGAVENNYVKFAGFYWRIIRINGDGSIRMIYDGTSAHANGESSEDRSITGISFNDNYNDNAYVGYMYGTAGASSYTDTHANTNNSTVKTYLESWYKTNIVDNGYSSYVVDAIYCNDRSVYTGTGIGTAVTHYSAYNRLVNQSIPSFECNQVNDRFTKSSSINGVSGNGKLTYPIGLITADEDVYAGNSYISGRESTDVNYSYYLCIYSDFWTMTPLMYDYFEYAEITYAMNFHFTYPFASYNLGVAESYIPIRPVISISPDAIQYGTGSSTDPFRTTSTI